MSRVSISRTLRTLAFERAGGQCEYCLIHQDDVPFTHPIDHVIAVKHGGQTVLSNLALSCLTCNINKGSDIAAIDPVTEELVSLFNPRLQDWDEHFRIEGTKIVGKSPVGRATAYLLQLNRPDRTEQRAALQKADRYRRA